MSYVAIALAAYELYTGMEQANAMSNQASDNLRLAELRSQEAALDAYDAKKDGYSQVARYQKQIDNVVGTQKVNLAAAGVDSSVGTARDLISDSQTVGFLNTLDIQAAARSKANGYEREATQIRTQGYMNYQQGMINANATRNAAIIGSVSEGLKGYSDVQKEKKITARQAQIDQLKAEYGTTPLSLEP